MVAAARPAGRETPVARVLTEPCLILGVEKPFAIVNATLAMIFAGELHLFAFVPVAVAIHVVLARITAGDAFTRPVYVRYNLQADCYDPWIQPHLRGGQRPFAGRHSPLA